MILRADQFFYNIFYLSPPYPPSPLDQPPNPPPPPNDNNNIIYIMLLFEVEKGEVG